MTATVLGGILVLGQGIVVWAILRFVKSFGALVQAQAEWTKTLLYAHETNAAVHESNLRILQELRKMTLPKKEVA